MHPLSRYLSVVDGTVRPRYMSAKSIKVDMSSQERRWEEHDSAVKRAYTLINEIGPEVKPSLVDLKAELARPHMRSCSLCPWRCGDARMSGRGRCGVTNPRINSTFIHMGEEAPLVPSYTIFFSGCNLNCAFCQNYDLSTMPDRGVELSSKELVETISDALNSGRLIKNVNWVGGDPIPVLPYVLESLSLMESNIAQIWNSNMYLEEDSMKLLSGVIDVYLTDLKFGNDDCAQRICGVKDYSSIVYRNHKIAMEQGEVIVRHLQLPGHLECCTFPIIDWLAKYLPGAAINLMDQYRPEHRAYEHPELGRSLSSEERREALEYARERDLYLL